MVAAYVDAGEVDGRVGQSEDVGAASAGGLYLAQGAFAVYGHVGDDIPLYQVVLVRDTVQILVAVSIEKFS